MSVAMCAVKWNMEHGTHAFELWFPESEVFVGCVNNMSVASTFMGKIEKKLSGKQKED